MKFSGDFFRGSKFWWRLLGLILRLKKEDATNIYHDNQASRRRTQEAGGLSVDASNECRFLEIQNHSKSVLFS